jgi:hypothetical protein
MAIQHSRPRELTSHILALSEVKAIIVSGCYMTRVVTYFSSYLVVVLLFVVTGRICVTKLVLFVKLE